MSIFSVLTKGKKLMDMEKLDETIASEFTVQLATRIKKKKNCHRPTTKLKKKRKKRWEWGEGAWGGEGKL